jgi:hypothetical protein
MVFHSKRCCKSGWFTHLRMSRMAYSIITIDWRHHELAGVLPVGFGMRPTYAMPSLRLKADQALQGRASSCKR